MKILICSGGFPTLTNAKEAAHIVTFGISKHLKSLNHQVDLQVINFENNLKEKEELPLDTKYLFSKIHSEIIVKQRKRFDDILNLLDFFFLKNNVYRKVLIDKSKFDEYDLILPVWSEIATRVISTLPNKKIAYYGNLEFLVKQSNISLDLKFNKNMRNFCRYLYMKIVGELHKRESISYLKKYSHVFNVSALDAHNLFKLGVKSSYLQMIWDGDNKEINYMRNRNESINTKKRVCCSVGNLSATGNTFGFITLIEDIIPEIERQGLNQYFRLQIYGGSNFRYESIRTKLINKGVEIMGFVEDLESELLDSNISIVPHNKFSHKVSHTRVLYNWHLGVPVILFTESSGPMPELVHNYNCLLANNAKEFVEYMFLICEDEKLRKKIIKNGLSTLNNKCSIKKVTEEILNHI